MIVLPTRQASVFCKNAPKQLTNRLATAWVLSILLSLVPAIAAAKESGALRIVTDIAPVHSLVLMVAGDHAQVDFIIKAGQSPHDAYLKPSDARKLQNADLVFHIGAHLAPQFERQTQALVHEGRATSLTNLPNTHRIEDAQSQLDPHSWLDINNARVWLNHVNKTLAQHNPANAVHFQHNYEQAEAQLAALDLSIAQKMATISAQPFIVQHDAFSYFTSRYKLKKLGALSSMSGHETGAAK